jgi:hypothetical protein
MILPPLRPFPAYAVVQELSELSRSTVNVSHVQDRATKSTASIGGMINNR